MTSWRLGEQQEAVHVLSRLTVHLDLLVMYLAQAGYDSPQNNTAVAEFWHQRFENQPVQKFWLMLFTRALAIGYQSTADALEIAQITIQEMNKEES